MTKRSLPSLMIVTDPDDPRGPVAPVAAALEGAPPNRVAVQLRAKSVDDRTLCEWAHELRAITASQDALLLINGRADVARAVDADGVHLPERGIPIHAARRLLGANALIGASRHDLDGVSRAATDGADYVTLSPIFAVPDKGKPLGIETLGTAVSRSAVPVFALGGINSETVVHIASAGATRAAVIRAVYDSTEPPEVVRKLLELLDNGVAH